MDSKDVVEKLKEASLPCGDAVGVFANELAELADLAEAPKPLDEHNVVQMATLTMQRPFSAICRKLLLPGSSIVGWHHLQELARRSKAGEPGLLCLSHVSNLDVPNLCTLAADRHESDVFNQIIWIAGRKLSEDSPLTQMLIQMCHRIVVTPPSWFTADHSDEEVCHATKLNHIAHREILRLSREGWVIGLFPTGTRQRPGDSRTTHSIAELDTYLKAFTNMCIGTIDGNTLPVSRDRDYTHEVPKRDRVVYTLGSIVQTDEWRAAALEVFPELDQRSATARAMDATLSGNR